LSVLRTAGNILREEPDSTEEMLLMRTLRDMNLSKLVYEDIPLFNALLADIFPKQEEPRKKTYPDVEKKIAEKLAIVKLVPYPPWVLKIIQLYETSLVRHGFMLIGTVGTGKTCVINCLCDC
jgi:dynein heavy chain